MGLYGTGAAEGTLSDKATGASASFSCKPLDAVLRHRGVTDGGIAGFSGFSTPCGPSIAESDRRRN